MTYEEWKKKRDEERATASSSKAKSTTQSGSESGKQEEQQETGYEAWKKRRQTQMQSEATDRVNQWLTEFRRFSDAYNARYRDKSQKYRSDSAYWLENVTKSQDRMRDMAQEISKYMEENRRILGNVFIARAEDMIWEGRKFQSSVVDQAREENDYYSQWENEDAFNLDMQKLQKREELLSFDTDAGQKEIDELKRRREELAQKNRKPASNYLTGGNDPVSTHYGAAMQNTKPGKEDEEIVELDRQISRKNRYLTEAQRLQKADRLAGVGVEGSEYYDPEIVNIRPDAEIQDVQYRYINDKEYRREYQKMLGGAYDNLKEAGLEHLTEDEKRIYNYYYAKEGKEKAQEYLTSIRETLNTRRGGQMFEDLKNNPLNDMLETAFGVEDNALLELAFGVEAGIDQFQSGMKIALHNREGAYVAPSARQIASGMVREDLGERGKVAQGAYDLITTTANMAPSILTSTVANILAPGSGAVVGSAMMGMSSGGSAYQDMINEGYSKEQAKVYGTLVGASETVLGSLLGGISSLGGKLSGNAIGKLMSKVDNAVLRTAIKIGGNMVSEGLEEGLQEILTPWFKSVLTGEEYEVATEDVLYASLLGALSAGLLEGPTTISEARGISRQGAVLKDAGITADRLAEIGKTFAADTVAYQLAGRVDGNTDAYTMGRLFNELDAELTRMNEDSIVDSLISKGVDERSARKLAEGFGAAVTGTPLTDRQKSAIAMNNVLAETVRETIIDPNSTVNQRSQGFNDLLHKLAQDQNGVTPESRQVVADTKEASDPSRMAPQIPGQENVIAGSNPVTASNVDVQRGYEAPTDTDDGTGLVRQTVADMGLNESAANVLVDAFSTDDSVDAETYATGIREAYRYGQFNYPAQEVAKGPFSSLLTEHQRNTAYKLGQMFGSEQATVRNNRTVQNGSGVFLDAGGGKVTTFSKKDLEGLNGKRRAGVEAAMLLKKLGFGNNYYFFESYENANGERVYLDKNGVEQAAPNGWYEKGDGSIHIDLNAGANADGLTLYTLSHELTHFVENWSKDKYRELAGFLASNYGKNGSVDELVMVKKEELSERRGVEVSDEEAYSEFIADSMEAMLSDGNVLQKLTEMKKTNRNLFDKIREFFGNLAKRITEFYKGAEPESEEGKAVLKMKDQIDQIQQMFAEALVDADENFRGAEAQKNTTREGGDGVEGRQYQIRQIGNTGWYYVQADRQVLSGTDPDMWGKQIESYINDEIRKNQDVAFPTQDGHLLLLTGRSAYKLKDRHDPAVIKKAETFLSDTKYLLKGRAATHIDELIQVAHFDGYEPDINQKHENDIGEDGFNYFKSFFRDFDGKYYEVPLSAALNEPEETAYSIGKIRQRRFPADPGSSSGREALNSGRKPSENIIYSSTDKSQQEKSAFALAYEAASKKTQKQDRSTDSVSNRSLLANAFEGVVKDDTERKKIREYRENVDGLNEQEKKLQELRKEIRELSFAKGKRDKAKLRQLREEAIKTANRIDVYDKRLLRLEAAKPLQNVLEREKQKAYQKAKQKHNEAMDTYRQKMVESQNEIVKRYQDARAKGIESRAKTAMRHKIQGVVKELNQYLLKGTKDKHVMEGLRQTVAEALDVVNMDTVGAEERIAKLERELMNAKTPEAIQEISRRIDNVRRMGDRMSDRLKALKDAYREIAESNDPLIANSHDEVIEAKMESVIENVGDTPLRDMNLNQLEEVYDMYRMVMTTIRNANKAFKAAKGENIEDLGSRVMAEVEKAGGKRKYSTAAMESVRKFGWNNLKPVYAFEHIGSNTLTQVFNAVRAGEDVWAKDVTDAKDFYRDEVKKHKYNSWDFRKRYSFTSSSGMDFSLSLEQIMSMYAYSKREQAADHLTRGGIVFDESTEVTMKTKLGIPVKFNPTEATAYNLSAETLGEIVGKLTEEQKAFVDEMQDYLSTTMGAKGNEVSMELYGIKLFKEKFYFPLKSATQFMAKAKEQQQGEVKIKNSGFSKETVKKANNPIVLTPFMDVWTSHVNEMSMYHAFVLPMEDFYRVWSYRTATSDIEATKSVEMYIQNAYGKGATEYIDQILKDLNGGARMDATAGIINKGMGLFKKGAVFASLSVVVQQPSAIARAAALMDTKYFIGPKVDHKRHKALWNEVKQYAPVAIIKEMGYFDTNMGKTTKDFIVGKEYSSISEKMKALVTDSNYRDEVLSKAPALADEIAWCSIWEAVKRETKAKHPGAETQSDLFLKKVGDRFTEIIIRTQVYDSVLSRSANMRSRDTGMKMATAFMAEPTTSINMIADALLKAKRGDTKYARKAIGAVVASQLLNSILVSFVYAARDDDEDETYAEKYVGSLVGEFADSLNPAGYIPFIKDIMSIVQGYDVERSDMAVISDLWNAWQKLDSDNLSVYRKVEGFAGSICQIFGLPVKNIMRDVRGVYQAIDSFVNGQQTTKAGIRYAVKGAISGKTVSDQQQLYEAYLRGDQTQIDRVESRYKDQSAVDSAIRKALRENDPRIRAAAEARINGNIAEYTRIAKEIVAEKHFSQDNVVAAINAEINTMNKGGGSSTTTTQKETGLYKMSDFEAAVIAGDSAVANAIRNDIIQTAQKNGKTVKEAEESFARSAGSSCRELFMDDSITKEQAIRILTTYCGKTREEADLQIQVYDWEKEVPGCDDITASAIREYNENCKNVGISKGLYYKAWSAYNDTDADYDENGDAIRNSKTQKVMRYINNLSLTKEQKTALAMCWYAESTVQKYKLW